VLIIVFFGTRMKLFRIYQKQIPRVLYPEKSHGRLRLVKKAFKT
jgi:hypothetical protein